MRIKFSILVLLMSALISWAQTDNSKVSHSGGYLELKQDVVDVGSVSGDSIVTAQFTIVNIGNEPATVKNIFSDCSCAIPNYSTDPIAPGDSIHFQVKYDPSKYKWGQFRRIFRISATGEKPHFSAVLKGAIKRKYRR